MCDGNLSALNAYELDEYNWELERQKLPECDVCGEHMDHCFLFLTDELVCDDEDCILAVMHEFVKNKKNEKIVNEWIANQVLLGNDYYWLREEILEDKAIVLTQDILLSYLEDLFYIDGDELGYDEFLFDYFYAHSDELFPDQEVNYSI